MFSLRQLLDNYASLLLSTRDFALVHHVKTFFLRVKQFAASTNWYSVSKRENQKKNNLIYLVGWIWNTWICTNFLDPFPCT